MGVLIAIGPDVEAALVAALGGGFFATLSLALAVHFRGGVKGRPGPVEVTEDEVVLGVGRGAQRVPLRDIVAGIAMPAKDGCVVRIEVAGGDVHLVTVKDAEAAERLLEALRIDPAHRRYTVRWATMSFAALSAILGSAAVLAVLVESVPRVLESLANPVTLLFIFYAAFPVLIAWVVRRLGWREVGVGTDGLFLRGTTRQRFVRFVDIKSVRRGPPVEVVLHDDKRIGLPTPDNYLRRKALLQRITKARAVAMATPEAMAELLARRGRPLSQWRDELVKQLQGGSYRDAPFTRETAVRILEDPRVQAEQRIAAALALTGTEDPEAASRIRIAADVCASPKLRVALEKVVDGDAEDAIESALDVDRGACAR